MANILRHKISLINVLTRLFAPYRRAKRSDEGMSCEVARDLIPLYADGEASAKTRSFVEAHVAVCPDCADYYRSVKSASKTKFAACKAGRQGIGSFAGVAGRIKRRRAIYTTAAAVALTLSLGCNLFILLYRGKKD